MADLLETAMNADQFKTLIGLIEVAGLTEVFHSPGPFTVLAPTDEAFDRLAVGTLDDLKQHDSKLKQVLFYHVISGDVRSDDLAEIREAPTLEGSILVLEHDNGIKINDARVIEMDILTENGVIHIIDTVLIPTILSPE